MASHRLAATIVVLGLLGEASGAIVAARLRANIAGLNATMQKSTGKGPQWNGDPTCIPQTGRRCFNGPSDCEPWVACSEDHYCVCHHWGCSDSSGVCRPVHNQWLSPDVRLAPVSKRHYFMQMPADGSTSPHVARGYPKGDEPDALWSVLMQPDNRTVMITTKLNRFQTNPAHVAHGFFLDVAPAPWGEGSEFVEAVQARPENVLQASWRIFKRPKKRVSFQHVLSGRFLCFAETEERLSTCNEKYGKSDEVGSERTMDFDIWPYPHHLPLWGDEQIPAVAPRTPPNPFNIGRSWEKRVASQTPPANSSSSSAKPLNTDQLNISKPWHERVASGFLSTAPHAQ